MIADWIKNLSLHFASGAGSSFIGCRRTEYDRHGVIETGKVRNSVRRALRDGREAVSRYGCLLLTLDLDSFARFYPPAVWPDAEVLWSCRLYLERYRLMIVVCDGQRTLDELRERAFLRFPIDDVSISAPFILPGSPAGCLLTMEAQLGAWR